jgi:thioredoxin 1
MKKSAVAAVVLAVAVLGVPFLLKTFRATDGVTDGGRVAAGKPRLVDIGSTTCIPCKVMLGVLDQLKQGYGDSLDVKFLDVERDTAEAAPFAIRVMPTQVFLSPDGRELWRHVGVIRADAVIAKWAELGYRIERTGAAPAAER